MKKPIKQIVQKQLNAFEKALFNDAWPQNGENGGMSVGAYETLSCHYCEFYPSKTCEFCGGRNRHPIPISELQAR